MDGHTSSWGYDRSSGLLETPLYLPGIQHAFPLHQTRAAVALPCLPCIPQIQTYLLYFPYTSQVHLYLLYLPCGSAVSPMNIIYSIDSCSSQYFMCTSSLPALQLTYISLHLPFSPILTWTSFVPSLHLLLHLPCMPYFTSMSLISASLQYLRRTSRAPHLNIPPEITRSP